MKIWYSPNGDEEPEERLMRCIDFDSQTPHGRPSDLDAMVELCAQDYYQSDADLFEDWPINLWLYQSEDGPLIGRFEVGMHEEPVFTKLATIEEGV